MFVWVLYYTDLYHSKVGDTRPRVFERTVNFGDSVQVRDLLIVIILLSELCGVMFI